MALDAVRAERGGAEGSVNKLLASVAALALLNGCDEIWWGKPGGVTEAEMRKDYAECERAMLAAHAGGHYFAERMHLRGYLSGIGKPDYVK
jgi:hypothetical protein